ncbi:MAG: PKD domain-containing protein [Saprospiraceae bacterium]|nr:PKD domain-containing protein [Saprospiraceae bacterium]
MKSRFLPALPAVAFLSVKPWQAGVKAGILLLSIFLTSNLSAQQDSIKIFGLVQPTCACFGSIDIGVTGGPMQPPSTSYAYFWSNGSTTQDLFNLCPGQYCVTVSNGNTNIAPGIMCFTVQQIPYTPLEIISSNTAPCNFDSSGVNDCEKVCPGITVTYSVSVPNPNGTSSPIGWQVSGAVYWVVNTNNSPFFSSITVTWGGPGTGSVTVFTDGAGGLNCSGEDALCVTVIEEPEALFSSSPAAVIAGGPLQVCLGQIVNFQNLSTGGADSYEWLFSDDLSTSSSENPQHTYLIPGMHTVRLIARSECLCSDTTLMTVEVLNAQAPTLDCVSTICPGETVTYTASNGCAPFSWTVSGAGTVLNGGTPMSDTISVQWNGGPIGTITLGAQPCSGAACPLAGVIEIPIITSNAQIVGEERVCPGATEVYTIEPFGGTGFVWTLPTGGIIVDGQGTNRVTVQWNTFPNPAPAADHSLYVQYTNCYLGCGGADLIHIRILPSFSISGPIEICENESGPYTATFNPSNSPILCDWILTAPDGSASWTSIAASVVAIPFLSSPGVYRLSATPADPNQTCSNEADWAVSVRALPADPTSILGETNICPGTAYTYEATGLPAGSNIRWTVKNGAGATQTLAGNPLNVTWGNTGPYWLSAAQVSKDGLGCLSDTVGLVATPIVAPTLSGTSIVCEDTKGSYAMLNLQNVDIQWNISPSTAGAIANGQGTNNVDIFWSQAGGHVISVSVCGQSAQFPVTVITNPDPVPLLPAPGVCPGATTMVQTVSTYASYAWKDESGIILSTSAAIVLGAGVYSIEVIDANGCTGASEFEIASLDAPNVSLTTADATGFCNNASTVSLTALTNTNGNYSYQWFKDGLPFPGTNSTIFTNQYGTYTVQATNSYGCTATSGSILLFNYCGGGGGGSGFPGGGGNFCAAGSVQLVPDPTPRCDSFHLVLNDLTGLYIPGSAQWTTGISGGAVLGTAIGDDATFVYSNAGKYLVLVRVALSDGTFCIALDSVFVDAVARFDERVDCPGAMTNFENQSEILPNVNITNYTWNFDDPASGLNNTSSLENPAHAFSPAGIYDVTLTITAASGCTASISKQVEIPDSDPPVFADPAAICAGNALEFAAAPNPDIIELSWDFGDPASGPANDAMGNTVYHDFPAGTYMVTATSNNVFGCTATFTRSITVQASTLSGNINPASPGPICEGSNITLTAPAGAVSYLWSDGSNTTSQTLSVGQEGSYKVTLTDANGCTYSPPAVNVEINPSPDALIKALLFNDLGQVIGNSYPTVTVCAGEDVALQAISNGGASFSWSGGNGNDQVVFFTDDRNTLLSVGTHLYSVTVTSQSTGCTAVSDPFLMTVNPVPSGFFISSPTYCAGDANVITYNGPTPANWQFFWNNGAPGTTLTTEDPGAYYIRVINEFGCETKSNVQTILPGPQVSSIPAGCHTRCSPDTLCIPNLPNITSWQWFLDGNPIPGATSPNFIAQQSGTYWAELTDIFGCSNESDPLSLNLFTGYGNILGQVWSDVNNNGMIDAADTLLSGVTVVVYQNGSLFSSATSGLAGDFALTNVLSTDYTFAVDPFSLPFGWSIVIGNDQTTLSGCDVTGDADFLLHFGCQAFGTLQLAACPGGFATYNGTNISVGGSQTFQLTSAQGCDSTLVVSVMALQTSSSAVNLSACPGSSANYNGTNIPVGTTQVFTLTNSAGCDSLMTVTVTALPIPSSSLNLSTCPGNTVNYNGTNLAVGEVQNFTFQNSMGCDSIVTVTVLEASHFVLFVDAAVCQGSFLDYQGLQIPAGTEFIFTQVNSEGCIDTTIITALALPPPVSNLNLQACPNGTVDYNGTSLPVGAVQDFTLTTLAGCDSIVTVTVTALPIQSSSLSLSACPNGSAIYNGTSIPVGTSQDFTLINSLGCDSIVTVTVTALSNSSTAFSVGVCPGETYPYQGTALDAGDIQSFTLTNFAGCDSIVTVSVFQKNVSANVIDVSVCPGSTYTYAGEEIAAGDSKAFHFTNSESCDSTVTVFVSAFPETVFALNTEPSCSNTPTGVLDISGISGGPAPYQYSLNNIDYQDSTKFTGLPAGTYTVYVEDDNGCVFEGNTTLAAIPKLEIQLPNGILPCDSARVQLDAIVISGDTTSLQYNWWNGGREATSIATEAGPVWVEVTDACTTVRQDASVQWAELDQDLDIVYIPNVFKPSSNGLENAEFKPFFAAGINLLGFHFEVFDRWGNKLFETSSTADGWGGIFRTQDFNPGVQVWHLEADISICGRVLHVERKGNVTVVR